MTKAEQKALELVCQRYGHDIPLEMATNMLVYHVAVLRFQLLEVCEKFPFLMLLIDFINGHLEDKEDGENV